MSPRSATSPGLPSVTEVLKAVGLAGYYPDTPAMDRARQLGTAGHLAIRWDAEGTLDRDSLHPEIQPGFEAYQDFCFEHGHIAEESELELVHPYGFIGHIDRVGLVDRERAILDFKFSSSPDVNGAKWQLGGYGLLWAFAFPDRPAGKRLVVALGKDGTYRIHDVTDAHAPEVFKAALIVYNAQAK